MVAGLTGVTVSDYFFDITPAHLDGLFH